MKNFLYITLLICFVFLSCGKKQEVKVYRNSQTSNSGNQTDTTVKSNEVPTGSGENELHISSSDAGNNINAKATVKGYVADVVVREKVAYLNFDKKYPKNTFSAVVFESKFSEIGDLKIYKNQNVEIKGTITEYKGKPQIILTSKNQISIVK